MGHWCRHLPGFKLSGLVGIWLRWGAEQRKGAVENYQIIYSNWDSLYHDSVQSLYIYTLEFFSSLNADNNISYPTYTELPFPNSCCRPAILEFITSRGIKRGMSQFYVSFKGGKSSARNCLLYSSPHVSLARATALGLCFSQLQDAWVFFWGSKTEDCSSEQGGQFKTRKDSLLQLLSSVSIRRNLSARPGFSIFWNHCKSYLNPVWFRKMTVAFWIFQFKSLRNSFEV